MSKLFYRRFFLPLRGRRFHSILGDGLRRRDGAREGNVESRGVLPRLTGGMLLDGTDGTKGHRGLLIESDVMGGGAKRVRQVVLLSLLEYPCAVLVSCLSLPAAGRYTLHCYPASFSLWFTGVLLAAPRPWSLFGVRRDAVVVPPHSLLSTTHPFKGRISASIRFRSDGVMTTGYCERWWFLAFFLLRFLCEEIGTGWC